MGKNTREDLMRLLDNVSEDRLDVEITHTPIPKPCNNVLGMEEWEEGERVITIKIAPPSQPISDVDRWLNSMPEHIKNKGRIKRHTTIRDITSKADALISNGYPNLLATKQINIRWDEPYINSKFRKI